MAMTFQLGPDAWCEEAHAKAMGYKRYVPTAAEQAATRPRVRVKAGVRHPIAVAPAAPPAAAKPATAKAPSFDKLPPVPAPPPVPLVRMCRAELEATRDELDEWLAKASSLNLSIGDGLRFDMVKARADEAYILAMMAR